MPFTPDLIAIEVDRATAETLRSQAEASGLTLAAYLRSIAGGSAETASGNGKLTLQEFDELLDELAAHPTGASLPADFSRADIYGDHD